MKHVDLVLVLLTPAWRFRCWPRFAVPHPSLLVLGGAALALVPCLPRPGLDPGGIFLIFVPPETVDEVRRRHRYRARRWAAREQQLGGEPIVPQHAGDGDNGINEPSLHYRRLRVAMIEAECQVAVGLSEESVIGATALRLIERDLDLEAMLLRDSAGSD